MSTPSFDFSTLSDVLPPLLWRHRWPEYSKEYGLPFSRGSMQNFDSEKRGPESVRFGKRVGYKREALIAWLNEKSAQPSLIEGLKGNHGN